MPNTILHVEDDPTLAKLVKTAFTSFGFGGEMLSAGSLQEACTLLDDLALHKKPLNLILSDMRLPDGTGLDVIRVVRSRPLWRLTPVVVLSGEKSEKVIGDAYAMGANCYLPKIPKSGTMISMLQSFVECWLEYATLPTIISEEPPLEDHLEAVLAKSISLRARLANVYMRLSEAFSHDVTQRDFWLERALKEGNFTNLIAFFKNTVDEYEVPVDDIDRMIQWQGRFNAALNDAEHYLKVNPRPTVEDCFGIVLDLLEGPKEDLLKTLSRHILPKSQMAAKTFLTMIADQITEIAFFIGERAESQNLHSRATDLVVRAKQLRDG